MITFSIFVELEFEGVGERIARFSVDCKNVADAEALTRGFVKILVGCEGLFVSEIVSAKWGIDGAESVPLLVIKH